MSYIDTFAHERIGTFAGLPVYHPLTTVSRADRPHAEFECDPSTLCIGGGSGEHSALVVRGFDHLVRLFLLECLDMYQADGKTLTAPLEALSDFLVSGLEARFDRFFHYEGWGMEELVEFFTRCRTPLVNRPFVVDSSQFPTFEHWLASSLGEFCHFHAPSLMGPLATQLNAHRSALELVQTEFLKNVVID